MSDTYVDSSGETRDRKTGKDVNPPADTPEQAKADPSSQGANALKPQSALAQKDESDIGRYEYGRAKAERPYLKGAESAIDSPRPPLPTYEKIKNEPNPEDYHKYSVEFASASALLGAIAGKWTRAGGTASLNAFAGAMQGWQKGNLQAYEEASKQWEQASKKTIDNNNIELAKYKAILEDRKMNIDDKLQGLTIAGYEAQNSVIVGMGKDGNFNGIAQAVDKMAMANQRYGAAVDQLSGVRKDQTADQVAQIEYLNSNPEFARQLQQRDPGKWAQIGAAGELYRHPLNNPPQGGGEQLQGAVDMVGQNRASLATVMSRMPAADKATFTRMLSEQYPEYRQQEFNAENAGDVTEARIARARIAKVNYASNLLDQNIPAAEAAAKAFPQGKYVPIDAAKLWAAHQGSDVALSKWDVVNLQMIENYAQFLNPGATTIRQDMFNAAASVFSQAKSTPAYLASLQAVKEAGAREREAGAETIRQQRGQGGAVPSGGGASGGDVPQRPQNIPDGSAYSPSRKMWKDPQGNLYDASGAPAGL